MFYRNDDRGTISIFLVIILPTLLIGGVFIYELLTTKEQENRAFVTGAAYSETLLSQNNTYLYENYGILAYVTPENAGDELKDYLVANRVASEAEKIEVDLTHTTLEKMPAFYDASKAASIAMIGASMAEALTQEIDYLDKVREAYGTFKSIEDEVNEIFEADEVLNQIRQMMRGRSLEVASDQISKWILEQSELLEESESSFEMTILKPDAEMEDYMDGEIKRIQTLMDDAASFIESASALKDEIEVYAKKVGALERRIDRVGDQIKEIREEITMREYEAEISGTKPKTEGLRKKLNRRKDIKDGLKEELAELQSEWMEYLEDQNAFFKPESIPLMDVIDALTKKLEEVLGYSFDPGSKRFEAPEGIVKDPYWNAHTNAIEKMMLDEYYLAVFKSFDSGSPRNFDPLDKKETRKSVLDGEVEYLIAGGSSDRINNIIVNGEIAAIRTAANIVYILKDPDKMKRLTELTAPIPQPWRAISFGGLIVLWSGAESYLDLKQLMAGEGFLLIKSEEEWILELDDLLDGKWLQKEKSQDPDAPENPEDPIEGTLIDPKLYYQDYLRILLLPHSSETLTYRTMQLIEGNLRLVSSDRYGLENMAVAHQISAQWPKPYMLDGLDSMGNYELKNGYEMR